MSTAASLTDLAVRRSARFVTWVRSWRAGLSPYDELPAQIAGDEEHLVADTPGSWTDLDLREALSCLAKVGPDEIALVLPAPGDPRGLPGPGDFAGAAMLAQEGVLAGTLGFVPQVRSHTSGSGDTFSTVLWQVYGLPTGRPPAVVSLPGLAEADGELATALAQATAALARLDVAQWRPELAGALSTLRRPDFAGDLPPGYDARTRRVFARASVLDRVLALAAVSTPGGATNGHEARQRDEALRPLRSACRRALMAACNAPLRP